MDRRTRQWPLVCAALAACTQHERAGEATGSAQTPTASTEGSTGPSRAPAAASGTAVGPARSSDAGAAPSLPDGAAPDAGPWAEKPMQPRATQDELLELLSLPPIDDAKRKRRDAFLRTAIGPGTPGRMNQGNPDIAKQEISRARCLNGLEGIVIQTEEQRRRCKGFETMVPLYADGSPESAKACIDVFEFPNRACELPFVWASASQAKAVCRALRKRLCTQQEWVTACSADPAGGAAWTFAYGEKLDLSACNTRKSSHAYDKKPCDPKTIHTAWKSCGTHTEPTGAFPRCRSRLGVFDLHGNVAEAMSRYDPEEQKTVSQLKGSAFFYVDVARDERGESKRENYPDHCAHDPRWHVEDLGHAWHVNYHLGFRCCLSLE
jgi:sulfatase modifying factor 1